MNAPRCLTLALLTACLTTGATAAPSIGFVSKRFVYLDEYDALPDLRESGFEVGTVKWEAVSADTLKPFNAIVLTDIPGADERGQLLPKFVPPVEAVRAYVEAGGGVLACMGAGGWDKGRQAANLLLKSWDAELLDEQVTDPAHRYRQTRGIRWAYSWTKNVATSPITKGVRTVYYPAQAWRADSQKTLYTFTAGDDWQVLVRGEASARSVSAKPLKDHLDADPATYDSEPPIVATREVGKGRVAVFALWPNWTFWGARRECMESIVWEAGVGGVPSDTGKLCLQLLAWLAEPSVNSGAFGGHVTPANPPTRPEEYVAKEIDWATAEFPSPPAWKHFRLLAGARTSRTVGKGTVAEYVQAAKVAGYQAIAFAERLEDLTPDEWNSLRGECRAATTNDFLALPGIDFRSLQGDEYVAFGEFDYPKPPGLAADGKHVDDTYNLWGSQMHHGFLAATRLHLHPERDPQILKNMTACAVHTYENGKLIDDSLDHYLALDAQFHNLAPLSLHLVNSPDEVKAASALGLQNVWRANDATDLKEQIAPHRQAGVLYWLNPHRAYLTSGPTLADWQGHNIMYWGPPAKGSDRWKIRLDVRSPAGVTEMKVLDRGRPYLRFANQGEACERVFPGFHDEQHVFHLLATDGNGGQLLSPGIRIRFSQAYANQCGDHQNTITACLQRNRKGRMIYTWGTTMGVYAGWLPTWNAPCPVDATEIYPPSWDGGGTGSGGKAGAMVTLADGTQEGGENSASTNLYEVAGPEVQILNQVVRAKYPEGTPQRRDCAPTYRTVPTEYIDYTVRRVVPTAKFERAGISLNTITIIAKQDFVLADREVPLHGYAFSDYGSRAEGVGDHVFVSFADGRALTRVGPPEAKHWIGDGDMEVGNYVCAFPNALGAGAVFPLTPVRAKVTLTGKLFGTNFGLALRGKHVKKGDTFTLQFLAVSASTTLEEGNEAFESIRRTLGIGCEPAYRVEVKQGEVTDTTGRLLATAKDSAFTSLLSQTKMPTDLFVQVSGLTDGWTAAKQVNDGPLQVLTLEGGTAYTNIDLNDHDAHVVCGHPVTCTNPVVRLVTWWSPDGLEVYAQNPTDAEVRCALRANDAFAGLPRGEKAIVLAAGGEATVTW